MLRTLRAFAWLRWRMGLNAFQQTGARDALERFSLAVEQLGPWIAILILIPSAVLLAFLGGYAGYTLAGGTTTSVPLSFARFMLMAVPPLILVGPFFLPAADRSNPVRLLLLPIPRNTLYVAQSSAAFGDPWNILAIPLIFGLVLGLLAAGALLPFLIALVAALLLVIVLVALASLATRLLHLMVRDRRRGELIALFLIVILPVISMLPAMLSSKAVRRQANRVRVETSQHPTRDAIARTAVSLLPTEMFLSAARGSATGQYAQVGRDLLGLGAMAALLHVLGFAAFRKVLDSPGSSGGRRGAKMRGVWTRRLPGLSIGASAVALSQLRLALRTPRGRSVILSPIMVFVLFGIMMLRGGGDSGQMGPFHFTSGIALATVGSFFAVLSLLPIAMNQFAIDKAGLTLTLLSPLTPRELLAGKALGNLLIIAPGVLVCIFAARLIFPGDPAALWLALPLGIVSMYAVAAPVAAIASATFPKVANLNSIGRGGNPHGLANLIGMGALMAGAGIPLVLALIALKILKQPAYAPLFLAGWCIVAILIGRILFIPAVRIFEKRREKSSRSHEIDASWFHSRSWAISPPMKRSFLPGWVHW